MMGKSKQSEAYGLKFGSGGGFRLRPGSGLNEGIWAKGVTTGTMQV